MVILKGHQTQLHAAVDDRAVHFILASVTKPDPSNRAAATRPLPGHRASNASAIAPVFIEGARYVLPAELAQVEGHFLL